MSTLDDRENVATALHLGAADYLVKPLRSSELMNLWTHVWCGGHEGLAFCRLCLLSLQPEGAFSQVIRRALAGERLHRASETCLRDRPEGGSPARAFGWSVNTVSRLRRRRHRETLPAVAAASLLPSGNDGGFIFPPPPEEREETSEEDDSCGAGGCARRDVGR